MVSKKYKYFIHTIPRKSYPQTLTEYQIYKLIDNLIIRVMILGGDT
jgi:hypothetical protein